MASGGRTYAGGGQWGLAKRQNLRLFALGATLLLAMAILLAGGLSSSVSARSDLPVPSNKNKKADKINPDLKTPPKGTRVNVVANRITYNSRTKIAVATGSIYMTYGRYVLVATKVTYDQKNDRMTAEGEVRLTEPGGNILEAEFAQLENKFRDGFARHLRLLLTNDATITADYARRRDGYLTVYQNVTYTRCKTCEISPGVPLWQIRSAEVTHDERKHRIYHRDATLEFLGLPVAYTPYFRHADPTLKRDSGLLSPNFMHSNKTGFGVEIPYFWNISPNMDVTFRPLVTTRQGPMARGVFRHRVGSGEYSIDLAGIYQLDDNLDPPDDRHFRGFARTQGDFRINDRWTWGWDITQASDRTFARRYRIDSRDHIENVIHLTGLSGRNYFSAQALQFRGLLSTDDNDTYPFVAPYIRHSYYFDQPVLGGELGFDTNVYSLYRDDPIALYPDVNQGETQTRGVFTAHWQRQFIGGMGTVVTPFARLRNDVYITHKLPDPGNGFRNDEVIGRVLPTAGVDMRWPFVRSDALGQHVMTPVAQVISASNEYDENRIGNEDAINLNYDTTSLFLTDRFTGLDRFEGGTRANVGMLYSLLLPEGGFLRASAGQSYHVAGDNSFTRFSGLEGTYSDLVAGVALAPIDGLEFTYQVRANETNFDIRSQEAGLTVTAGRLTASASYVDVDAEPAYGRNRREEQVWSTADFSLGGGLSIFGGARYDLVDDKLVRALAGVGYECDCFTAKVFYKFDNTSDNEFDGSSHSIFLSVDFHTLGGATVGTGL
ncbi:MAG: LPS-assembly protein LptD [Parvibaculaceae bacterium]